MGHRARAHGWGRRPHSGGGVLRAPGQQRAAHRRRRPLARRDAGREPGARRRRRADPAAKALGAGLRELSARVRGGFRQRRHAGGLPLRGRSAPAVPRDGRARAPGRRAGRHSHRAHRTGRGATTPAYAPGMSVSGAVADLDAARDAFVGAYEDVPDPALVWLKPGDDYALGGIVIHVQNSADEYTATLQRLVDAGFRDTEYPAEDPAELGHVLARARAGIGMGERATAFMDLARSHDRLARLARGVPEFAFDRLVAVTYPSAAAP